MGFGCWVMPRVLNHYSALQRNHKRAFFSFSALYPKDPLALVLAYPRPSTPGTVDYAEELATFYAKHIQISRTTYS